MDTNAKQKSEIPFKAGSRLEQMQTNLSTHQSPSLEGFSLLGIETASDKILTE